MIDPADFAPPIPFELSRKSVLSTIGFGLRPVLNAPSYAASTTGRALLFFVLSALPLALLTGIIPYTYDITFTSLFGITTRPGADLIVDIVRAMGIGALVQLGEIIVLTAPFVSLCVAYGSHANRKNAALNAAFYSAWLLPLAAIIQRVGAWGLPPLAEGQEVSGWFLIPGVIGVIPTVIYFVHLRSTARLAAGVGPMMSFITVGLAFALLMAEQAVVARALQDVFPNAADLLDATTHKGK